MNCDLRTVIKLALGLGAALAVAYFALPAAHAFILASAPLLLALVCPIAMVLMMKGTNGSMNVERARLGDGKTEPGAVLVDPDKA